MMLIVRKELEAFADAEQWNLYQKAAKVFKLLVSVINNSENGQKALKALISFPVP